MRQFTICLTICIAVFGLRPSSALRGAEVAWVTVGHPGNGPDRNGRGGVNATFQIMRHEVTCGEYAEFLNTVAAADPHGLWDTAMGNALAHDTDPPPSRIGDDRISPPLINRIGPEGRYRYQVVPGMERMPIVNVSLLDAMRFTNWIHHRIGEADEAARDSTRLTESGSYDVGRDGGNAMRSARARVWIPSEDEWYKAAYYHPESQGGPPGGYWLYPTRSNEPPVFRPAGATEPQSANFLDAAVPGRLPPDIGRRPRSEFIRLFPVGSFPNATSFFGTLDQAGNAWEWTESVVFERNRVLRGGSMAHPAIKLRSNVRSNVAPDRQYGDTGFRLARSLPAAAENAAQPAASVRPFATAFFTTHCQSCHEGDAAEGGLDVTTLVWQPNDPANLARWVRIHDRVQRGDMPPATEPRPPVAETETFGEDLSALLSAASLAVQQREGRVVYRRLNRAEYEQTLHDLLGITLPLQNLLPEDATAEGFDTVAAAHSISAVHLERYLLAADRGLAAAVNLGPPVPTTTIRTDFEQSWHDSDFLGSQNGQWTQTPEGLLAIKRGGEAGRLQAWSAPVRDARYRFRIRGRGLIAGQPAGAADGDSPRIILQAGVFEAPDSPLLDQHFFEMSCSEFREFEFVGRVPKGPRKTLFVGPFRAMPGPDGTAVPTSQIAAVIEWVEIEGPLPEAGLRGRQLLYGDLPLEPVDPAQPDGPRRVVSSTPEEDARRLLAAFLPLAFRRPVTAAELDEHLDIVREQLAAGRPFDEALRAGYKLALCSPRFLFLQETAGPLDDFAIAARLSYGLHGTAPDAKLRRLAAEGLLRRPEILRAQTERLLTAPEGHRFIRAFLASWLNLRDIDFTQPDSRLYPEFDPYLQQSMLAESEAFFSELLTRNLSATNIVHSDFAMLNERLAEHYAIPGVSGAAIRRVSLPPGSHRGGVLTQGAVLKVSANGTTTSPVVRGAYVLDRILGTPPDPPPRNVPALEPDTRGATTIREQLAKHRDQIACAGCHAKLDPPGFALESYDVTGAWRSQYRVIPQPTDEAVVKRAAADEKRYIDGPAVDPSGRLVDGRSFTDIEGLKRLLLDDPAQVAHCLTEKFVIHLTGATIQFADREVVKAIVESAEADQYGARSLLHGVIQSRLFTHK